MTENQRVKSRTVMKKEDSINIQCNHANNQSYAKDEREGNM